MGIAWYDFVPTKLVLAAKTALVWYSPGTVSDDAICLVLTWFGTGPVLDSDDATCLELTWYCPGTGSDDVTCHVLTCYWPGTGSHDAT